jgi:hypothetical protein
MIGAILCARSINAFWWPSFIRVVSAGAAVESGVPTAVIGTSFSLVCKVSEQHTNSEIRFRVPDPAAAR